MCLLAYLRVDFEDGGNYLYIMYTWIYIIIKNSSLELKKFTGTLATNSRKIREQEESLVHQSDKRKPSDLIAAIS